MKRYYGTRQVVTCIDLMKYLYIINYLKYKFLKKQLNQRIWISKIRIELQYYKIQIYMKFILCKDEVNASVSYYLQINSMTTRNS